MKRREIIFSPEARDDLLQLYDWLSEMASPSAAASYIERLEEFCMRLGLAAERGRRHDKIRPGLRALGFERRATIAFSVENGSVFILRVFYGGQDWERAIQPE